MFSKVRLYYENNLMGIVLFFLLGSVFCLLAASIISGGADEADRKWIEQQKGHFQEKRPDG